MELQVSEDFTSAAEVRGVTAPNASELVASGWPASKRPSPFITWHRRKKYDVMQRLFYRYLRPGSRVMDVACGEGDALVLAKSCCDGPLELWGLDIYRKSLDIASARVPSAILIEGDMRDPPASVPRGYFDVVHEFGATFYVRNWGALAKTYLSLLREGGVLLWELPQRWSTGHVAYLLSLAPKIKDSDTRLKRVLRTFLPSKYTYLSDGEVREAIGASDYRVEVVGRVVIWYLYCRGPLSALLDLLSSVVGERLFDWLESLTKLVWPRYAGYYLVLRKGVSPEASVLPGVPPESGTIPRTSETLSDRVRSQGT
jgi:SAM-dependent methyltransferase